LNLQTTLLVTHRAFVKHFLFVELWQDNASIPFSLYCWPPLLEHGEALGFGHVGEDETDYIKKKHQLNSNTYESG